MESLLSRLRLAGEPVDVDLALSILSRVSGALDAIHSAGLVHRDVKPANIMVTPDGAVLMDLGVVSSQAWAEGTITTEFLGTIRYAAPEYLLGELCDHRADVFSIGAIAYELLTGSQFDGEYQHWARLVAKRRSTTIFRGRRSSDARWKLDSVSDFSSSW